MDAVDKIGMALTPGTVFNQQNNVFRSAKALAQFAGEGVDQGDVLTLVAEHLADRVTIRPSAKRPENGPLIALTEFIPEQEEQAVMVKIVGGNAIAQDEEAKPAEVATPEKIMEAIGQAGLPEDAVLQEIEAVQAEDPDDEEVA